MLMDDDLRRQQMLSDFDETISVPTILSHEAYTKGVARVREHLELMRLENLRDGPRRIMHGGCLIALDRERQPDKPGHVRKPGIRRQSGISHTKKRWSAN